MRRVLAVLLIGLAGPAVVAPADAAARALKVVWTGSGHASIAQYRDSRLPDTKDNWDVYSKRVQWRITIPFTVSGGAVQKVGRPRGSVSGTGTTLGRSGGVTSCSGPVELPTIDDKPTVPLNMQVRGGTRNKLKLRITNIYTGLGALPVVWAFVPACGTSISNAIGIFAPAGSGAAFGRDVAFTEFSVLLADNFRASPSSFGTKWELPPYEFQRAIDYAFSSRVKIVAG